ncbi:MAG: hypothetical protein R2710_25485 [Acidimicrobiales bacterium]
MSRRKALHAIVSDGAHDQWHDAAASHGVSVTAMLEVLAHRLPSGDNQNDGHDVRIDDELVEQARKIDAQRRSRVVGRRHHLIE